MSTEILKLVKQMERLCEDIREACGSKESYPAKQDSKPDSPKTDKVKLMSAFMKAGKKQ